ncbi:MAG: hypothetical protein PGN33_01650 [Methylobacterium radiotolerans]
MTDTEDSASPTSRSRGGSRTTLDRRFVTRMSRDLGDAVAISARSEGLTAGAWVRRILLERVGMQSALDARSGRAVHAPTEDVTAVSEAVRELASVNRAITLADKAAAMAGLDRARELLIPVVMRRSGH